MEIFYSSGGEIKRGIVKTKIEDKLILKCGTEIHESQIVTPNQMFLL